MNIPRIPVLLLTGYLGSGKTTLLNRILSNNKGIRFAVIVNDIGEVNIDADLIQKGGVVDQKDDSLVALQNGCICCTLKMDLVQQITGILELRRFDYIVIEASGICEPAPIAQTICTIPEMNEDYIKCGIPYIDCIVTMVDALRMKDEFEGGNSLLHPNLDEDDIENLLIQQIEFCNIVLVNKAAEVSKEELGRVHSVIRALQPEAKIIDCNYGDVPFDEILETGLFDFDQVAGSATWVKEVEAPHHDDDDDDDDEHEHHHEEHEHHHEEHEHGEHHHHHDHEHHHHHHDEGEAEEYGIGTYVYYARKPFNLGMFDHFVAKCWPKSVIRAKGLCYFSNERDVCYLFEQAGKQVSLKNAGQWYATMPKHELQQMLASDATLRHDWDPVYGDRMQKLVFIGQHLNKEEIKTLLDGCLE